MSTKQNADRAGVCVASCYRRRLLFYTDLIKRLAFIIICNTASIILVVLGNVSIILPVPQWA